MAKFYRFCCSKKCVLIFILTLLYLGYLWYQACHPPLHFIHIPKNAGTYITNTAFLSFIFWGQFYERLCFFDFDPDTRNHHVTSFLNSFGRRNFFLKLWISFVGTFPIVITIFKIPGRYFPMRVSHPTFCIIRDPFERLLSEYLFRYGSSENACNKKVINSRLVNTFQTLTNWAWDFKSSKYMCSFSVSIRLTVNFLVLITN